MATAHHPGTRGRVGPETISYQRRRMQPKHALASRNTRYDLSYYGRTTTKERTRCRHIENMCVPSGSRLEITLLKSLTELTGC